MKVLIVGVGYWGEKLLKRFSHIVGYPEHNVLVSDINVGRELQIAVKYAVRVFSNIPASLDSIDAVVIATPIETHYSLVEKYLQAGKHVLVEKPMCVKGEDARELMAIAKSKNCTLMCDSTFLYDKRIGDLTRGETPTYMDMQWSNPRKDTGEGILWVQGPHPISLMLETMGMLPYDIEVEINHLGVKNEPTDRNLTINYLFSGGRNVYVQMSWDTPYKIRYLSRSWLRSRYPNITYDFGVVGKDDPLTNMCRAFIKRCNSRKPFRDEIALRTVEVLEWTQQKITQLQEEKLIS